MLEQSLPLQPSFYIGQSPLIGHASMQITFRTSPEAEPTVRAFPQTPIPSGGLGGMGCARLRLSSGCALPWHTQYTTPRSQLRACTAQSSIFACLVAQGSQNALPHPGLPVTSGEPVSMLAAAGSSLFRTLAGVSAMFNFSLLLI